MYPSVYIMASNTQLSIGGYIVSCDVMHFGGQCTWMITTPNYPNEGDVNHNILPYHGKVNIVT